jgi:arginine repressor
MLKKGGKYTMMMDEVRIALCNHKKCNPTLSQAELQRWLKSEHNIDVSQPTISQTLKRSTELVRRDEDPNIQSKRQRTVKFPAMEETLAKWILVNQ